MDLELTPAVFDLQVPRAMPCSAVIGPQSICGATPTSQYRRICVVVSHCDELWLCPVHAAIVAAGGAICRQCAINGGVVPVKIVRVINIPVRLPKE